MNPNGSPTKSKISFKKRVGVLASVLWIILVLVVTINANYNFTSRYGPHREFNLLGFFNGFVVFGIIPILLAFGVAWVAAARRR